MLLHKFSNSSVPKILLTYNESVAQKSGEFFKQTMVFESSVAYTGCVFDVYMQRQQYIPVETS